MTESNNRLLSSSLNFDQETLEAALNGCPYLGSAHDRSTRYIYPTPMNYCYLLSTGVKVDPNRQRQFCLAATHINCPRLASRKPQADPAQHYPRDPKTVPAPRLDLPERDEVLHERDGLGAAAAPVHKAEMVKPRPVARRQPRQLQNQKWLMWAAGAATGLLALLILLIAIVLGRVNGSDPANPTPAAIWTSVPTATTVPAAASQPTPATGRSTSTPSTQPTPTTSVPASATTPGDATSPSTVHVVRAEDTLWSIASAYGVTVEDVMEANDLTDRNYVWIGQRLTIPNPRRIPQIP